MNWTIDAGGGAAALTALVVFLKRTTFVQSFRDRKQLVVDKIAALSRAKYAEATVAEMKPLVQALAGRVQELEDRVRDIRAELDSLNTLYRLALQFVIQLIKHIRVLEKLLAANSPMAAVPPAPGIPPKLWSALKEQGMTDLDDKN